MTEPGPVPLPRAEIDAAGAVRRLGEALIGRHVGARLSAEVARRVDDLVREVERQPRRTKTEALETYPGHQRIEHFVATGEWPAPPADGGELTFDALSFVSGRLNPFSGRCRLYREGDEAVARARFSPCYEGPPERVHGGMVASAFDEVMGSVFRVLGIASAFTGTLTVRYLAPAPVETDLEFRARLTSTEGRKHTVDATATGPDGLFATATATFVRMSDEYLARAVADTRPGAPTDSTTGPRAG